MLSIDEIHNAHILIVDDQQANVLLLEQMLSEAGYLHISSTQDPFSVYAMHSQNHYDLILLDLQMPDMDGFQVMDELKELEVDSYVPILVITAQPDHKLRALAGGAKDFVAKPFDLLEIKNRIHNMLEVRLLYKHREFYNQVLQQKILERTVELRESEARFRRLTELASDWYWEQDENAKFTKVYGPVLEMLGIPVDTLISEKPEPQTASWNEQERTLLKANISARRPFLDLVCSRIDNNGTHQYFQVSGEPMFNESGRFIGYRGVGRDITATRQHLLHPHAA
ncbi:MAG: response regulator [Sulfuriferula sp.]|nr:response regulator [Sulfuriferula sp.]